MMRRRLPRHRAHQQQGVVLYVALVVLIAMTFAGLAVLRSVGTGVGVAGNVAFKQNAVLAADRGAQAAVAALLAQPGAALLGDVAAAGYRATWDQNFDPLTFDWDKADNNPIAQVAIAADGVGNRVRYVIHRMCKNTGASEAGGGQECAVYASHLVASVTPGSLPAGAPPSPLFRVTTRVDGPRNTVSYVQTMVFVY
ncbi:MAG: hypothetical protein WCH44_02370 [Betaproteobacteria bacterium]